MIDTTELGAGSYPTPPEKELKEVKANVVLSFDLEFEVYKDWTDEEIQNYIAENYNDFIDRFDEEIIEINIK